ncbi:hypothetical protein SAMN04488028_10130 [Reichenbachiella agariperforans]|uniref:Cytochrome P460 n=1 Tax=Reichenbachiella agariperforans TaxID=156994 RepID=A0A1M6J3T8_REIAG|nr:hypothetical protein [Reichenbachiella agariperforans]SHJ41317.1 hypothetical protein SAMN04488028_10130 [Reichenbachiella agariperforans]
MNLPRINLPQLSRRLLTVAACAGAMTSCVNSSTTTSPLEQEVEIPSGITVSSALPADLPSGAANASLSEAAEFAWNEFIALNWPAVPQSGLANTRDTPDTTKLFGDQSEPLVWHTYRSKVEIYPWNSHYPNGSFIQGDSLVFDYDALPAYFYKDSIPPCAEASNQTALVNLDETSQISLNFMFAGINPAEATATNSSPQLIRFLAKGNRSHFDYVTSKGYFNHGGSYYDDVQRYSNAIANDKVVPEDSIVSFPSGTIMVKAAWRLLTAKDTLSQYHTTKVRYYEKKGEDACYYEDTQWGLVALHIIHKTPTAPYFTFATFEQKDNLLTTDGKPIEDAEGKVINPSGFDTPTTPEVKHTDSPSTGTTTTVNGPFCDDNDDRLFYLNTANGLPSSGNSQQGICVNSRYHDIPETIIAANTSAHQAIASYDAANGISNSPWRHYKLVNIQYQPFDTTAIDTANKPAATYYQANIVVETNYTLQKFGGRQIANGNEAGQTSNYGPDGQPFYNVHLPAGTQYTQFNMGGCMGCHGNAQVAGADFSFILRGGPVLEPDVPEIDAENLAALKAKYRF